MADRTRLEGSRMAQGKEGSAGRVLMVTDQAVARAPLTYGARFAQALGAELEHWMIVETADERRALRARLAREAAEGPVPGEGVPEEIKIGLAVEILSQLDPDAFRLVILSFGGRRGLKKVFPRSEVLSILRHAKVHFLVLWGKAREPRRVLFLAGGSDYARQAVTFGAPLTAALDAEATLLYVMETEPEHFLAEEEPAEDPTVRKALARARRPLDKAGVSVRERVRHGRVVEQVQAEVIAGSHDLVVVGSHGRSGIRSFLLGSVVEELVRRSRVPLLVVRAQEARPLWRRLLGLRS